MRNLFAVSRFAYKRDDTGNVIPALETTLTAASSVADVEKLEMREALRMYPKSEGWKGHRVSATPILQHHVDYMLGCFC